MMSQLANVVLFPLLFKIPNKTVYKILGLHLCPGSIIQYPSKHLKLSDNRRTHVPMFLAVRS